MCSDGWEAGEITRGTYLRFYSRKISRIRCVVRTISAAVVNDNKCYLAKRMLKLKLLICIRLGFDTATRLSVRSSQFHKT